MEYAKYRIEVQDAVENYEQILLEITELEITDSINDGYHGSCTVAVHQSFDWVTLLNRKINIHINKADNSKCFPAICCKEISHEADGHKRYFTLHFADPLFHLGLSRHSQVYQKLRFDEIVEIILARHKVENFQWRLDEKPCVREYCVQYQESDLDFVKWLLHEEGVNYAWERHDAGVVLSFFRGRESYAGLKTTKTVPYKNQRDSTYYTGPYIENLKHQRLTCLSSLCVSYFDPEEQGVYPRYDMQSVNIEEHDQSTFEYIHFGRPDFRKNLNEDVSFDDWGKRRLEQGLLSRRALSQTISAETDYPCVEAGVCFNLIGHDNKDLNDVYLPITVHYKGRQASALEADMVPGDENYFKVSFEAVFASAQLYPWKQRNRRKISGLHCAVVWGPPGMSGCFHDEMQRVVVRFDWDYVGPGSDELPPSRWIASSQPNSGNSDGGNNTPDIGSIVYVAYQHGDPDQPIIVGAHHDARQIAARANSAISRLESSGSPFSDLAKMKKAPEMSAEEKEIRDLEAFFGDDGG